jgi:hypothetical protein
MYQFHHLMTGEIRPGSRTTAPSTEADTESHSRAIAALLDLLADEWHQPRAGHERNLVAYPRLVFARLPALFHAETPADPSVRNTAGGAGMRLLQLANGCGRGFVPSKLPIIHQHQLVTK